GKQPARRHDPGGDEADHPAQAGFDVGDHADRDCDHDAGGVADDEGHQHAEGIAVAVDDPGIEPGIEPGLDPRFDLDLAAALDFALQLAGEADAIALRHYRSSPEAAVKQDGTLVTAADREVEAVLRERLHARYPSHAILGEEAGFVAGASSGASSAGAGG